MRHATKMLLIPEDVYKALLAGSKSLPKDKSSLLMTKTNAENTSDSPADQMLTNSRQKLAKIKRTRGTNPDAHHINYIQEFKRYKKYGDDVASKPVNVHVNNLDQMAAAIIKKKEGKEAKTVREAAIHNALELGRNLDFDDNISLPDAIPVENVVGVQQSPSANRNKAINKKQLASPNIISLRSTIQPRHKNNPYQKAHNSRPKRINREKIISATLQPQRQTAFKATVWDR